MIKSLKKADNTKASQKQPRRIAETEAAMREAREIAAGRIPAKSYPSAKALFRDLDAR